MTKILDKNSDIYGISFKSYSLYKDYILTEAFIEKYKYNVDWIAVSWSQKLSESFIIKYQDKIGWHQISYYQMLSNKFIAKYKDKLYFIGLRANKHIDKNFVEKLELLK